MKAARLGFLLCAEAVLADLAGDAPIVEKRQVLGVLSALGSGDVGILGALGSMYARLDKIHANRVRWQVRQAKRTRRRGPLGKEDHEVRHGCAWSNSDKGQDWAICCSGNEATKHLLEALWHAGSLLRRQG
jgi:hypothetical protein